MSIRISRLATGGAAALASLWLIAAPHAASAQWWEDEEAFAESEEGFRDYGYYGNYGDDTYDGDTDRYGTELGEGEEGYGVDAEGEDEPPGERREGLREESYEVEEGWF